MSNLGPIILVIYLAIIAVIIAGLWKVYAKAGEPGWTSLVPIYNTIVLLRIVGKPWWWIILMLIPVVGIIVAIMVLIDLARVFGKGAGFAVGLIFLGFVFIPILGFGSATYLGPTRSGRGQELVRADDDEDEDDEDEEDRGSRRTKSTSRGQSREDDFEDDEEEERDSRPKAKSRRDAEEDEDEEEHERPRKTSPITAKPPAPANLAANEPAVIQCSNCQKRLRLPANVIGKKVKCPQCGNVFVA